MVLPVPIPMEEAKLASMIETHRPNWMLKLNLHTTAEIVLYAVRKRLIV